MSISAALLTLSGCLLLASCSAGALPTGSFRGEHPLAVNPGTDPVIANQLKRVDLTIAEDGKVTMENGGIPIEGQASRQGDKVDIEVLAVSGINVDRQQMVPRHLTLTIEGENKLRFGDAELTRTP